MRAFVKKEKLFLFLMILSSVLIIIFINSIRNCSHIIYFCQNVLFNLINSISNFIFIFFIVLFIYSFLKQVIGILKERKFIKNLNLLKNLDNHIELRNLINDCKFEYSITSKINIFENDLVKLSFTAGLTKPRIYLSSGLIKSLNQDELKAVIYHEMAHCQKRDPLRKFFVNFLTDSLFFLPIIKFFKNYIVSIQERNADNKASSFVNPLHLASALIKVAKGNREVYSTIFSFKYSNNIENRIKELIYGREISFKFPFKKLILSFVILILIFNIFLIPQFYIKASNCECLGASILKHHFHNCCEKGIKFGGKN